MELAARSATDRRSRLSRGLHATLTAQLTLIEAHAHAPDGTLRHPRLLENYRLRARQTANYSGNEESFAHEIVAHFDLVIAAVAAGREELVRLHRAGDIDDETLHNLERDLDLEDLAALAAKVG